MMRVKAAFGVAAAISAGAALFSQIGFADAATARAKAEAAMLAACKQEYRDVVQGKSLDEIDRWAEASENGQDAAAFKRSRCFKTHEKWEKLAQKNEWAPDQKRQPATQH